MLTKTYSKGKPYDVVKSSESDERYAEYDILSASGSIGSITRYAEDHLYTAWGIDGRMIAMCATLEGAVKAVIQRLEGEENA